MRNKNLKKGVALISILAISAIILVIISTTSIITIVNSRMSLEQIWAQKSFQATESLVDEVIMRFIRDRSFTNPYPDWTTNCLQIKDFACKMNINLDPSGGSFDVWGKVASKIRHVQVELEVEEDESVTMSAKREL